MKTLARYEILEELNRLGINTPVECNYCLNDYIEYCAHDHETLLERITGIFREATAKILAILKKFRT